MTGKALGSLATRRSFFFCFGFYIFQTDRTGRRLAWPGHGIALALAWVWRGHFNLHLTFLNRAGHEALEIQSLSYYIISIASGTLHIAFLGSNAGFGQTNLMNGHSLPLKLSWINLNQCESLQEPLSPLSNPLMKQSHPPFNTRVYQTRNLADNRPGLIGEMRIISQLGDPCSKLPRGPPPKPSRGWGVHNWPEPKPCQEGAWRWPDLWG